MLNNKKNMVVIMIFQLGSVQNPSIIPFNPGWFIGIPLLDYCNPQYRG